jgi:hypothetical protein
MQHPLSNVPRRIFLDSCTAQTLRDYGSYIYDGEPVREDDRIHRITNGIANLEALRSIFIINDRALFEWIVSHGSLEEAHAKRDTEHLQWLWDIADHSEICLHDDGATEESTACSLRLNEGMFGYLSEKDRLLLQDAVLLQCDTFLTMERRLPQNAKHIQREIGIRILTPTAHWAILKPWAALWL